MPQETETIEFYDKESSIYSLKRYDSEMIDFTQFYFRKRLSYVLKFLEKTIENKKDLTLLEVGCADGVVIRKIEQKYPNTFGKVIGTDISSEMIEEAKKRNTGTNTSFCVRNELRDNQYDYVLEVGFLTKDLLKDEFEFSRNNLKNTGYYICSLPQKDSLRMLLKVKGKEFKKNNLSAREYEILLNQNFKIIKKDTYGLFIPYIWKIPRIARVMQPLIENIMKPFLSMYYHESIYLLQIR